MTKKLFLLLFSILPLFALSQKEDYIWRLGTNSGINFNNSQNDTFSINKLTPIGFTNAGSCDSAGNLLFYTNGIALFNSQSDTMLNGDSLNPCLFTSIQNPLPISQADIIIKRPNNIHEYYLFHETMNDNNNLLTTVIYLTKINMSLDSGKGSVTLKNFPFYIGDTLIQGKLSAVKHGNGRDWWLVTRKYNPCIFYTWLIQPDTIKGPYVHSVTGTAPVFDPGFGQVCFSPDGETYAAMYMNKHLYLYNFDRCSGELTFKFTTFLNDSSYTGSGCAFSSSGQFLYVSTAYIIYQFDLHAANIDSSKQVVAVFDGFASPDPPNYTRFNQMRLAPDSKIYISTDNGCDAMHVIEYPDSPGLACNVMQHSLYFSDYFANVVSVPNIPDYKLGAIGETGCDSGLTITEIKAYDLEFVSYPNPVSNNLFYQIFSELSSSANIKMYDPHGRLIYDFGIVKTNEKNSLNVGSIEHGIYFLEIANENSKRTFKVIVVK
jgi:hypothetical protein